MDKQISSLRLVIQKWFAVSPAVFPRINRLTRGRLGRRRYVAIEASRSDEAVRIYFFRHRDGSWQVLPADAERPTFSVS